MRLRESFFVKFPEEGITAFNLLDYLAQGGVNPDSVRELAKEDIEYIREKQDCADFRLAYMMRILYTFGEKLPKDVHEDIIQVASQFPYEDCGGHGMCTWTENHRLYIDGSEYLAAQKELTFADGRSAAKHKARAARKITAGLNHIERFGFSEWGSNNYYPETMAALSNIIQFVSDEAIHKQASNVMDMLLFDICSQTTYNNGYVYNPATARAYVDNKVGTKHGNYLEYHIRMIMGERFGCIKEKEQCFQLLLDAPGIYGVPANCIRMLEEVKNGFGTAPEEMSCGHVKVIRKDESVRLIESVQGLNISDYHKEGLYTDKNNLGDSVRYAMTAGAISDYRLICDNMRYMCGTGLIKNSMLGSLHKLAVPFLYRTGFLGLLKRFITVIWDAAAQERGNVSTYNFGRYSFSAAYAYHVGKPLFQQNTLAINLSHEVSLFVNSPYMSSEHIGSPDYWTGSAIAPWSMVYGNIAECIFDMRNARKGLKFTHLFFPTGQFDEVDVSMAEEGILFGRSCGVNICVRTNRGGHFRPIEESLAKDKSLVAPGKVPEGIYVKEYDFINTAEGFQFYNFEADDKLDFAEFKVQMLEKNQGE